MKPLELFCPQCKSNSYINPGMKVFVSPCYHSLCEMCVSRLFSNGPNKCPECGISLRRSNYTSQTFEDVGIERECRIRKIVMTQIGKSLEDYSDEEDYNDYLEKIEEIVDELAVLKGPREVTQRLQEIKEELGLSTVRHSPVEPAKRRKTEEVKETVLDVCVSTLECFYPSAAIEYDTIPQHIISKIVRNDFQSYKALADIMIRKASMSLNLSSL
ncbi:CDK-activating kinase assembly factor MAT1 [Nematocida minor]|uniref:CDK-activating kinase assembly factor MAT1 n=1 Tax=Nematocida minor TaxID=1912983 RepID=UPI00221E4A65|nr:CDK-activating kinase assembly factor MAT1 [Nematocida minor]KAI5189921.1 CDK-activating kinase assembly factor MAT1 [Nematocida minor]